MAEKLNNGRRIGVTAVFVTVFMAGFALSSAMYANLLPEIIKYYGLSLTKASLLDMTGEAGQVLAMLVAVFLLDRTDKNTMIGLMMLLYGAAMALLGFAPVFAVMLLLRLATGISGSLVDNLCATYMSDLYGERRDKYVSILHTFFAVGSMIGPIVAAFFLERSDGWSTAYRYVGLAVAALAVAFFAAMLIMKKPVPAVSNIGESGAPRKIPFKAIFADPNMLWLCLGSVLLSGVYYINIWTPTYLQTVYSDVFSAKFCSLIITVCYLGMIVSRLLFGALSSKVTPCQYLRLSCVLTAADIVFMILVPQRWAWFAGMLLFGVFSGAQYTAKFLMAFGEFPEFSATVAALIAVFNSVGSIAVKYVINSIADAGHYTGAMLIPAALLALGFFVFRFGFRDKKAKPAAQ